MIKFIVNGGRGLKNLFISIGLTLIVISMLVFLYPTIFAYVFAGFVGLLGLGALVKGITSRTQKPRNNNNNFDGFSNKTEDASYQELDD